MDWAHALSTVEVTQAVVGQLSGQHAMVETAVVSALAIVPPQQHQQQHQQQQHWSAAAETRWERFAGTRSPLQLAASCPQSKSRSQSHADVQLRLSRSSQVWAKKKLSPAAAFTSGMRRSWELLLPGASAHCGGRHWCDPNRAVCHRPTHGSTNQWLVNHRTQ